MANTYTQIYLHLVFAVHGRQSLIDPMYNSELQKYITGVIQNKGNKLLAINNMPDHMHAFIGLKPDQSISALVRDVKSNSSSFIHEMGWQPKFAWQEGFGAFSHSRSQMGDVIRYIENQQDHHKHRTFKEEYLMMLHNAGVEYNDDYLFKWIDVSGRI